MANGVTNKFSVQHLDFVNHGQADTPAGELTQTINGETHSIVNIELEANGKPLGNHFHKKLSHAYYVIKGRIQVTLEDLDDHSRTAVTLQAGDVMRIRPNCAHAFIAQENSQVIEMNDAPVDPADTTPYVLL